MYTVCVCWEGDVDLVQGCEWQWQRFLVLFIPWMWLPGHSHRSLKTPNCRNHWSNHKVLTHTSLKRVKPSQPEQASKHRREEMQIPPRPLPSRVVLIWMRIFFFAFILSHHLIWYSYKRNKKVNFLFKISMYLGCAQVMWNLHIYTSYTLAAFWNCK